MEVNLRFGQCDSGCESAERGMSGVGDRFEYRKSMHSLGRERLEDPPCHCPVTR